MNYKDYEINKHNSTVCGYPGRGFDWSKFDFGGTALHKFEGKLIENIGAWVDDGLIEEGNQYLHVPYNWEEDGTIYRVRPNESMRAGQKYHGHLVKETQAIRKDNGYWYWRLIYQDGDLSR